jgi:hypothetical protein
MLANVPLASGKYRPDSQLLFSVVDDRTVRGKRCSSNACGRRAARALPPRQLQATFRAIRPDSLHTGGCCSSDRDNICRTIEPYTGSLRRLAHRPGRSSVTWRRPDSAWPMPAYPAPAYRTWMWWNSQCYMQPWRERSAVLVSSFFLSTQGSGHAELGEIAPGHAHAVGCSPTPCALEWPTTLRRRAPREAPRRSGNQLSRT